MKTLKNPPTVTLPFSGFFPQLGCLCDGGGKNIMKNQLRKLNALSKMIDLSLFYDITVHEYNIQLQGKFHSKTVAALKKIKVTNFGVMSNDYLSANRGSIQITLN